MKTKLGIHIGMKENLPFSDGQLISLIRSSLLWQEHNGPIIIFVDEPFYNFMYDNDLEQFYQDIIPIDGDTDREGVVSKIVENANYDSIFVINLDDFAIADGEGEVFSVSGNTDQKDFVDLQLELLPEEYKKLIWHNTQPQG